MRKPQITRSLASIASGVLLLSAPVHGQETTRVSVDSAGMEANDSSGGMAVSADGWLVVFDSPATNLVAGDTNGLSDVFLHDRFTGITERVSVSSSGAQADSVSIEPSISADGQLVAFASYASNLVAGDTNGKGDIFVHDRTTGLTERVSVSSAGVQGNGNCYTPVISADGRYVAFPSDASDLVGGDTNHQTDVFVHDRTTGLTERVSVDSSGAEGNGFSLSPSISADGQIVAFASWAWNLVGGDTNNETDIFVHDRSTGITARVSVDASGAQGNGFSDEPWLSADGQTVAFASVASNLIAGDTNGQCDVFVHDRSTGLTERVSVAASGAAGDGVSLFPSLSADGRFVAFASAATNLVAADTNLKLDVFVHDRSTGLTDRASVDSAGTEGNDVSFPTAITADGRIVAFGSAASNLVAGDTNPWRDIFLHQRNVTDWSNYGAGFPGTNGVPSFTARNNPVIGATITLDLANSWGTFTNGLLFFGFQRTQIHSGWGGDLLVVPLITQIVGIDALGMTITGALPNDPSLVGVILDLQAIELDPGARKGMSFTAGLELVLGY